MARRRESVANLLIDVIELVVVVVAVQGVLVDEVGYGRLEGPGLDSQKPTQKGLVLLDSAQQDAAHRLALLVLAYYFDNGLRVLLPDLLSYKGRVGQHEVEVVVVLLRNGLWVVQVVLEEVRVVLCEFLIELSARRSTSKRM